MTRAEIRAGDCGFVTRLEVQACGDDRVQLTISSDCPAVSQLSAGLEELNPYGEMRTIFESAIYRRANECLRHPSCIVPAAILRAVGVETKMMLPEEISVQIQKDQ